jgi:hypothetical protein
MIGWHILRLLFDTTQRHEANSLRRECISTIVTKISKATSSRNEIFRHPALTAEEHANGSRLGIDSWADTCCAGKHCYVQEFVEGKTVTASGFTSTLGALTNLPIANVVYAYDDPGGYVLLLECNNSIYLGDKMDDSLLNPIQNEENGVRIDTRPRLYYPESSTAQTMTFPDGTHLQILYDGVLPYLPVRRPTKEELHTCKRLELTSRDSWDPFLMHGSFSKISGQPTDTNMSYLSHHLDDTDPVGTHLMSLSLPSLLIQTPILFEDDTPDGAETVYSSISKIESKRKDTITPEALARRLNIGLATATRTLKATTHQCLRTTGLLTKRFKTDKSQLRYKQLTRGYGTFYTDYLKVSVKSLRGYIGGVIYTNKLGFKKFFPCETEQGQETGRTLRNFIELVGLPVAMHSDNHSNFKEGFFKSILRKFGIYSTYTEPHSPWQNRAEPAIGEVKRYARQLMQKSNTPVRLWCFCYEYSADVLSLLATGRFELQGRTPYEAVLNYTPDISEYASFSWYQWCYYFDEATKCKSLCRWLGPAHHIGQSFCSYILLENGTFIARSSVVGIPEHELLEESLVEQTKAFTDSVESKIGNYKQPLFNIHIPKGIYYNAFGDDMDADDNVLPYGDELVDQKTSEVNEAYLEALDEYIGVEVVIPGRDAQPVLATVKKRKRDPSGMPSGTPNPNPILDTRVYELEFPDGRLEEYAVNIIAENLLNQADGDGWDTGLLEEIIDIRKDEEVAVPIKDGYVATQSGQEKPVITTKGWDVQVRWQDQSTGWVPLADIKESNPVQVAEFVIASGLEKEPAFNWWARKTLKRRDRIIKRLKVQRVRKGRMKFGIEIPGTVEQAKQLDKENGNTLWQDAITKEMKNSRVAFKLLERGEKPPVGHKEITCHLIFDLKLDMTRKARYVAGGHLTDVPTSMTYSTVVSRDTVRIGFLVAALNNLDILAGDIQNAFLEAPTKEKIFFYSGDEWKADKDRVVVVVRALYGLKSSALQFRNHLADTLGNKLGFKSSLADPDLWYKAATDPSGNKYYSYILVYVDDLLIIDKLPKRYMSQIQESFTVKPDSIEEPKTYLGADVSKVYYPDGSHAWTMGSESYVKKAVKNMKAKMAKDGLEFNKKLSDPAISVPQPLSSVSYRPELDTSVECTDEQVTLYQNIIGILRWVVELGRIDIAYEVSILSRYLVQPRTGHLLQALHIFKYLDIHSKNELAFDPATHEIDDPVATNSRIRAMKDIYPDAEEDLPPNAPEPRGNSIQVNCFVDSDHAGDRVTRRSQTGIILYCNSAPIVWYSKRQNTVESSTFGSEFVALRIASELIISLRYKLRMFGIPVDGPANVFCDNESVYKNSAFAESTLKKKHNSICFHRIRECVASGILVVHKVDTHYNLSDILTKSLPANQRVELRKKIMFCEVE